MDTQVINVAEYATDTYFKTKIEEQAARIQQLEEHNARIVQRDFNSAASLNALSTSLQEWTMENLENNSITEEQALELSEIGGFELTKEVEAEVNVTYYITVQVPAGESAEDIINDIDFDAIVYDTDNVTHISSSVDSIDI